MKSFQESLSLLSDLLRARCHGVVQTNEPLSQYVVYRVGGPADVLFDPADENDLKVAVEAVEELGVPLTILGNGSNVLIRDGGIRGLVLWMGQSRSGSFPLDHGITLLKDDGERVLVSVSARCAKAQLLDFSLERGLAGLEFSAGIPGSLGGAVAMNAGTKWGSYSEVIHKVNFFNPEMGFYSKVSEELGLRYRGHGDGLLGGKTVVVSVELWLRHSERALIRAKVDEILTYRGGKQPLELPNCGSVFKNPEGSELGAGRLIEACGLKGLKKGGAQVSTKHANFILNTGSATASDIEGLIGEIRRIVQERRGILLEPEVMILGAKEALDERHHDKGNR